MKNAIPVNRIKYVMMSYAVCTIPEKQMNIKPTDF